MKRNLVAENWRLEQSRYAVVGTHCEGCTKYYFPIQEICLGCNTDEHLERYVFKGSGKLIEWTKIYDVASGFELYTPIYYGIIELDEGVKISVQLTGISDEEDLEPGMKTEMEFRKLYEDGKQGVVTYGFKARPIYNTK